MLADAPPEARDGLVHQIAAALRERILTGALAPGVALRQDHVAAEFETSHIPVREAFRRLESDGFVVAYPRRGVFVARLDPEEAEEITEMRAALEALAVRRSVPLASAEHYEAAAAAIAAGDASPELDAWSAANWRFHRALYAAGGRPRLMQTLDGLWLQVDRYLRVVWRVADYQPHSQDEHRAILAAYRARDVETAERLTRSHILDAGKTLLRHLAG